MAAKNDQESLERAIAGGLRSAIHDHGPITQDRIASAVKRIMGNIRNARVDGFARELARRRWEDVPEKERQRHQADAARAGWAGRTSRQRSAEMSRRRQEGLRRRDVKQKVIGMLQAQPDTDYPIVVTTKCIRCGRRLVLHATSEQALPIGWQDLAECPACWSK